MFEEYRLYRKIKKAVKASPDSLVYSNLHNHYGEYEFSTGGLSYSICRLGTLLYGATGVAEAFSWHYRRKLFDFCEHIHYEKYDAARKQKLKEILEDLY